MELSDGIAIFSADNHLIFYNSTLLNIINVSSLENSRITNFNPYGSVLLNKLDADSNNQTYHIL